MNMPLWTTAYLIDRPPFRTEAITNLPLANLRAPSFLPATLFDTHVTLWIILIAAGIATALYAHFKSNRRLLTAAGAALLLILLWIASAMLLETPLERLHNAHSAMATAAQKGDTDTLLSYLAPDFTLQGVTLHAQGTSSDRDALSSQIRDSKIREVHILHYESKLTAPASATTTVTVFVTSDSLPPLTTWRVTWQDDPTADWRITAATLTRLGNEDVPPTGISAL